MNRAEQREVKRAKAEKMADMYRQGLTLESIGRQFGCTREYVRQLISGVGVTASEGGKAVRSRSIKATTISKSRLAQARQENKHGVPYELLRELRTNGATAAFQQQRNSARNRGIAFCLSLAQWWAIWQASGKFHIRGRGVGRYCMSRIGDDGAYELGNVHVQLATENSREAVCKWNGKTKPIKGVFCLYPGRDLAWLAKYGKVSLGYFATAEAAGEARKSYMQTHGLREGKSLGSGRGWTFDKSCGKRPYLVQVSGTKNSYHSTQAEAEAEYKRRCAEVLARKTGTPQTVEA